ncbi:MAG: hypothetical protein Tsb0021_14690 [Chlamydiales bacterium]
MRNIFKVLVVIVIVLAAVMIYLSLPRWTASKESVERPPIEIEKQDQEQVQSLLERSKPQEALVIIKDYEEYITPKDELGSQWLDLLIQASVQVRDAPLLVNLYEFFPNAFEDKEEASLIIARSYLAQNKLDDYDALRSQWEDKLNNKREWILSDVDRKIASGDRREAMSFLREQKFSGQEDSQRLLRLALLAIEDNPQQSWNYLKQALIIDPDNPVIHLYRGRLLEVSQEPDLALSEFISAVQIKPDSIPAKDQLAEFYVRQKQYERALEVWKQMIEGGQASEAVLLKALFWGHVAYPEIIDWDAVTISESSLKDYIDYLIKLPQDRFWNRNAFEKIPNRNRFLKNQPTTYWLRLIQALKDEKEDYALELIKSNPFKERSVNPELETALQRILQYRKTGHLSTGLPVVIQTDKEADTAKIPFFRQLEELAWRQEKSKKKEEVEIPSGLEALLKSKDAFATAFLVTGWLEAALALQDLKVIPEEFPNWVSFDFTQALRENRGVNKAIAFAQQQPSSPELNLLIAELYLVNDQFDNALPILKQLAKKNNPLGRKALWLESLVYTEQKNYSQAKQTIQSNQTLSESLMGQELLARIAILEERPEEAERIYSQILDRSAEAKSYFARKAYADKNWERAKELTQELLVEFPNNPTIRQNWNKILKQQNQMSR